MLTDKQVERNRLKIPEILIKQAKFDLGCGRCTLGVLAKGLNCISWGGGWENTKKELANALGLTLSEVERVESIHDSLQYKNHERLWPVKKIHQKAYNYLIQKHNFPVV